MGSFRSLLALSAFAARAHAATHELIVGTFGTNFLYTLEFDDEALTLNLAANTSVPASSSWIALSHDKRNLYGTSFTAATPQFVGYTLASATGITYDSTIAAGGDCNGTAIYVVADPNPPYAVYGSLFGGTAGCGGVMSVEQGVLTESIQNYTYFSTSGVHGTAFSPDSKFLYSADDGGNTLWTHSVDSTTGELTYVANLTAPSTGADPRHVAVHPGGQYLYVILEGASELGQYTIDAQTGIPSYDSAYPLKKSNESAENFWADEVALSFSGSYLWATNRARNTDANGGLGYISAFELDESGAILKQNFLLSTTSSGGSANSVAPSAFSDRFVALTDSDTGFVEIWELAEDGQSAAPVAHLDLADGGCCANAVWYS
ncbi:hypothetical protein F5X96DRAFT_238692 [Biscogniauxia mediterranea]|nr:hypothetical protein F5X96DRAFT_238692 [Biscogniauxia mediterranea]